MAIVKMNRFCLYFLKKDRLKVLDEFQSFGSLEFRDFDEYIVQENVDPDFYKYFEKFKYTKLDETDVLYEQGLNKMKYCLDVLRPYVAKQSLISSLTDDKLEIRYSKLRDSINLDEVDTIYAKLRELHSEITSLESDYAKCISDMDTSRNWENIGGSIGEYKDLRYVTSIFGSISRQFEIDVLDKFEVDFKLSSVHVVHSNQQDSFFSIIVHNDIKQDVVDFLKIKGFNFQEFSYDQSVSCYIDTLRDKIKYIIDKKEKLINQIKSYCSRYVDLQLSYEYFNSNVYKNEVYKKFLESDSVLVCRGYVEENKVNELKQRLFNIIDSNFYLEINEIDLKDSADVPIKLSNGLISSSLEGVVEMYSYPTYSEVDPTPAISVFFIVFFGMMLADAGYGILITLASVFLYVKSKTELRKTTYRLFIITGVSTIVWGILYGAYFGDLLQRYFGLNVPVVLDVNTNIMTIFAISVGFGFVHLVLGLIMKAIVYLKNGKLVDVLYDVVPWLLILSGVLIFALQTLINGVSNFIVAVLIVLGILILLFTQGRESKGIAGKIGGGVYGVYGITGYLGDIISYSRLLALGLASGFIANAFNIMGGLIPFPLNLVITPIILIPLHLFNLGINALGTYVHSARLQYLEFFGKFYTGGGRKFSPFRYTDQYVRIKK